MKTLRIIGFILLVLLHLFFIFWVDVFHYVGYDWPFLFIFFLPGFLLGAFSRKPFHRNARTLLLSIVIALLVFSFRISVHAGLLRLLGCYQDLFFHVFLFTVFILAASGLGSLCRRQTWTRRIAVPVLIILLMLATAWQVVSVIPNITGGLSLGIDVSDQSYKASIQALCDRLAACYPYLEYKNIDMQRTRERALARADSAETPEDFLNIVRAVVCDLQDGHMWVRVPKTRWDPRAYASFGAWFVKIDDRWITSQVVPKSSADSLGFRPGMVLLRINGEPVSRAVRAVPDDRMYIKFGTPAGHRFAEQRRLQYILTQPVGSSMSVTFLDLEGNEHTMTFAFEKVNDIRPVPSLSYKRLPDHIGYIKIRHFAVAPVSFVGTFEKALEALRDTEGLIIDIRDNNGGAIILTDQMLGRFTESKVHYGAFRSFKGMLTPLYVVPRRPVYKKDVVLLMNEESKSAAEYFAYAASHIDGITLMGRPTYGMVSNPGMQSVQLPDGLNVELYTSCLADVSGRFVVEWVGVQPDRLIPYDIDAIRQGIDRDLEEATAFLMNVRHTESARATD